MEKALIGVKKSINLYNKYNLPYILEKLKVGLSEIIEEAEKIIELTINWKVPTFNTRTKDDKNFCLFAPEYLNKIINSSKKIKAFSQKRFDIQQLNNELQQIKKALGEIEELIN